MTPQDLIKNSATIELNRLEVFDKNLRHFYMAIVQACMTNEHAEYFHLEIAAGRDLSFEETCDMVEAVSELVKQGLLHKDSRRLAVNAGVSLFQPIIGSQYLSNGELTDNNKRGLAE